MNNKEEKTEKTELVKKETNPTSKNSEIYTRVFGSGFCTPSRFFNEYSWAKKNK